jgi:hypothetical protein
LRSLPLIHALCAQQNRGRSLNTSFYEDYLREARQRQETAEFTEIYCLRPRIEGKQAELVDHGLRDTRYVGKARRRLQRLWLAAVVNLKRLFKLSEIRDNCLLFIPSLVSDGRMVASMA